MSITDRIWRAALPPRTHEWAVIPEDEPRAWEYGLIVSKLPQGQDPWKPIPVEVVSPRQGREALRATVPWWSGSKNVLVLRDEAVESVGSVLAQHGELLPLEGRNARLVMFSAPLVVDGMIEDESELHQSPGSFYVRLDRGVFRGEAVGDLQAFVVQVGRGYDLFFTEELARKIEATGDTAGVVFEQIGILRYGS